MHIHPEVAPSCLLLLGIADPADQSVWNIMPPHPHERRMEANCDFDLSAKDRVLYFMGRPDNTRHLVVASGDADLCQPPGLLRLVGARTANARVRTAAMRRMPGPLCVADPVHAT